MFNFNGSPTPRNITFPKVLYIPLTTIGKLMKDLTTSWQCWFEQPFVGKAASLAGQARTDPETEQKKQRPPQLNHSWSALDQEW